MTPFGHSPKLSYSPLSYSRVSAGVNPPNARNSAGPAAHRSRPPAPSSLAPNQHCRHSRPASTAVTSRPPDVAAAGAGLAPRRGDQQVDESGAGGVRRAVRESAGVEDVCSEPGRGHSAGFGHCGVHGWRNISPVPAGNYPSLSRYVVTFRVICACPGITDTAAGGMMLSETCAPRPGRAGGKAARVEGSQTAGGLPRTGPVHSRTGPRCPQTH